MITTPTLHLTRPEKIYGSSLLRVAEAFEWVFEDFRVTDLAEAFQAQDDRMVVGVCDAQGRAQGIVSRVHLFNLLGKPFGREILSRKPVAEICQSVETFDMNTNLFQAAERLQSSIDRTSLHHYLLTDSEGHFRGIFSSKDLLAYLSKITQEDIHLAAQLQERLVKNRLGSRAPGGESRRSASRPRGSGETFTT